MLRNYVMASCSTKIAEYVFQTTMSLYLYVQDEYFEYHVPAHVWMDAHDCVYDINCPSIPHNCQVLFSRPKPGHWPRQVTVKVAITCGVFLCSENHSFSSSLEHVERFYD